MSERFWSKGLRFQCQGSGNCCVSRGGYGYVYLTLADRRLLAKQLGLNTASFTKAYCERHRGIWRLKDGETKDCLFLKSSRCSVYGARPTQCRTWPFWPEVLNARTWNREVKAFCPGVGKGRDWTAEEIRTQLDEQVRSEEQWGS